MIALLEWLTWGGPLGLAFIAFAIWMLVDALRRGEWLWAVFILLFAPLNAPLYFFLVYRQAARGGFELPGPLRRAADLRARIKELEAQIHHLDKAHHHAELGDIFQQQGRLDRAAACYRAALEREPDDPDTQAHYGQCLLRLRRAADALPLLEQVFAAQPDHDFGQTGMALAEACTALGRRTEAIAVWRRVLERHSPARARVQLAELLLAEGQTPAARAELESVLHDDAHAPEFQRRRERPWVRRAKALMRKLPAA